MSEIEYTADEQTEEKRYGATSEATDVEKEAVGGEKNLSIKNVLFQSNADAQTIADTLKNRLKSEKEYVGFDAEFCPIPIERGDEVRMQEYVTPSNSIWHTGTVRQIRLSVAPDKQILSLVLEES